MSGSVTLKVSSFFWLAVITSVALGGDFNKALTILVAQHITLAVVYMVGKMEK